MAHRGQTVAGAGLLQPRWLLPGRIVDDVHLHAAVDVADADIYRGTGRVFDRVGEGFLDNAVSGLRRCRGEPVACSEETAVHGRSGGARPSGQLGDGLQPWRAI